MIEDASSQFKQALREAQQALRAGDSSAARHWAKRALALAPEREEGWLLMARVASPRASVAYLEQALKLNPHSQRARQGMHWAVQRLRQQEQAQALTQKASAQPRRRQADRPYQTDPFPAVPDLDLLNGSAVDFFSPIPGYDTGSALPRRPRRRPRRSLSRFLPLWAILVLLLGVVGFFAYPPMARVFGRSNVFTYNAVNLIMPTLTPTITPTPTATATFTPTPTDVGAERPAYIGTLVPPDTPPPPPPPPLPPTPTELPTQTPLPTLTFTPTLTPTVTLTPSPTSTFTPTMPALPEGIKPDAGWIDVNLSEQRLYVYQGTRLLNSFEISSGAAETQTLPGSFRIYAKNKASNMMGQEYDVPAVPYVLFYDKDFALHGAYWHDEFGKPVSHGCVNLRVDDARWIFDWAPIGTLVKIHY